MLTLRDARFAVPNELWTLVSDGIYRTTQPVGWDIHRLNGQRIVWAKDRTHFDTIMADQVPVAFRGTGETLIYLGGDDPRTGLWISSSDAAVLACTNSPRLHLEGIDIRFGGAVGINFAIGCDDSVIDGVTIFGGRDGVRAKDALSKHIIVRRSWIVNDIDDRWWWRDVKGNTPVEGTGLTLPGVNQVVEDNVIEGWMNGVGTVCNLANCPAVDPIIRRNLIRNILDDAIEMDGITVRGEVSENLILNTFVGFSFAPRLVQTPGEDTWIHHNAVQATRVPPFDRAIQPLGTPSLTKFNGGAARDLLFEHNTAVGEGNMIRGAPSGGGVLYPIHVRWFDNIIVSRVGPLVRHTGAVADGNSYDGNVYSLAVAAGNAFQNWTLPLGQTNAFATLAQAKASAVGQAAGWEARGLELDPQLLLPGQPSSLKVGSPAEGRGAFQRSALRVDSVTLLPTGWILVRGQGFQSRDQGLGLRDPIVVSNTTAFAREFDKLEAPTILGVEIEVE